MALNSINTNTGAMIALQNLNVTNTGLNVTQNRINTGLKVASAKDNGAIWAIAQNSRADISSLDSVKDSIQRGQSTVDVAISAGETVSDLLNQMKAKALAAADTSLDATSRTAMNDDFKALRNQIAKTIANASFNGTNLIKTAATNLYALADATGASKLTVAAQSMGLGSAGALSGIAATASFSTAAAASVIVTALTTAITNVNAAVAKLGTGSKALQTHLDFVGKLQDTMTAGVGNLVDADVAKESATLQALQTKQQLGIQALSIANSSTSAVLSLFR
ncbi:MAG: flagellin [Caulobacterales bacterium 32-69-10]|nr:MAG: flagellin [Caulobacterales bacterium 32-69-10]